MLLFIRVLIENAMGSGAIKSQLHFDIIIQLAKTKIIMKTKLPFLLLCFAPYFLFSQCMPPAAVSAQDGNKVNAPINNTGGLFLKKR